MVKYFHIYYHMENIKTSLKDALQKRPQDFLKTSLKTKNVCWVLCLQYNDRPNR